MLKHTHWKRTFAFSLAAVSLFVIIVSRYVSAGPDGVLYSQGSSWRVQDPSIVGDRIAMVSANDGWILQLDWRNDTGNLYRYDGIKWTFFKSLPHTQDVLRGDIEMVSATDGWIALGGPLDNEPAETTFYRWNGNDWVYFKKVTDPNAVSVSAIDMLSSTEGWATASFNFGSHFYHWNGNQWQKQSSVWLPAEAGNDIDMLSTNSGWAIGFLGHIFRWNGNVWSEVPNPIDTSLNGISMVSETDGWIVGNEGVILHWDGNNWSEVSSSTDKRLNDVQMLSSSDGWAVGGGWNGEDSDPGTILHWDGVSWTQIQSPTSPYNSELLSIDMLGSTNGWITGAAGVLIYEQQPAEMTINHNAGASGSFFSVTGSDFPQGKEATVTVNGQNLGSVPVSNDGTFSFILSTTDADEGYYSTTASVNPSATVQFVIDNSEPTWPQEGSGPVINVPAGIAFTEQLFMPVVLK